MLDMICKIVLTFDHSLNGVYSLVWPLYNFVSSLNGRTQKLKVIWMQVCHRSALFSNDRSLWSSKLSLCPVTMDRNFYVACLVWSEIGPRSNNIVGPSQGMFLSKFYRLPEWPIFGIFAVYIALQPLGTRLIIKTWYSIGNHRSFDTLRLLLVGHSFAFAWNGN